MGISLHFYLECMRILYFPGVLLIKYIVIIVFNFSQSDRWDTQCTLNLQMSEHEHILRDIIAISHFGFFVNSLFMFLFIFYFCRYFLPVRQLSFDFIYLMLNKVRLKTQLFSKKLQPDVDSLSPWRIELISTDEKNSVMTLILSWHKGILKQMWEFPLWLSKNKPDWHLWGCRFDPWPHSVG